MFNKILRAGEGKIVRRLSKIADAVESLEPDVLDLTDAELRARTDEFKERYADGQSLDRVLAGAEQAGTELSGGDFVRWARMLIDLLDQLAKVADGGLATTARAAVERVRRGVVAVAVGG